MKFYRMLALAALLSPAVPLFAGTPAEDYQMGSTLYASGQYSEALNYFNKATQADPNFWQAYQGASYCQFKLGKPFEAKASCEKSLALHPDNPGLRQFADSLKQAPLASPLASTPVKSKRPGTGADKWKEYGLRAGVGMYSMSGGNGVKSKIGPALGGYYTLGLGPQMAIEPGGLLAFKGAKIDLNVTESLMGMSETVESKGSISLTYLEIPVLFKYYFNPERKYHVLGGLGLAFALSKKMSETVTGTVHFPDGTTQTITMPPVSDSSGISSTDFSLILGAGAKLGTLTADLRYEMGLSSVSGTSKNGAFEILVSYPLAVK